MKVVIFGASSHTSLGYYIGDYLAHKNKYDVIYASRSGKLGLKCDVTNPKEISSVFSKQKPNLVIYATGVFSKPELVGKFKDWEPMKKHILAKSLGILVLANEAIKSKSMRKLIVLGGRDISAEPGFAAYSIGNGALWSFVRFFAKHKKEVATYYVDLPFIKNSTMEKNYMQTKNGFSLSTFNKSSTDIKVLNDIIQKIIKGKYKSGSRFIVDKKSKI